MSRGLRGQNGLDPRLIWIGLFLALGLLLYQTYDKANRPEGYDLNTYLFVSKALWSGADPYLDSVFPYIWVRQSL